MTKTTKAEVTVTYRFYVESEAGITQADVDANDRRFREQGSQNAFTALYDEAESIIEDAFWPRQQGQFISEFEWSSSTKLVD